MGKGWIRVGLLFGLVGWLVGCAPSGGGRVSPRADAGTDQSVATGATVTLDGTGSTGEAGATLTYQWSWQAVPVGSTATLSDASEAQPTFTADVAGAYVILLTVSDGQESSLADSVTVTAAVDDQPPTAVLEVRDASGAPLGGNPVGWGEDFILDGSRSSDVGGGTIATYRWTAVTAGGGGLTQGVVQATGASTLTVNAGTTPVAVGTQTYSLVVVDDSGNESVAAQVQVTVEGNSAPVSNAGSDQSVAVDDVVTLDATGSSDPDGDPLTYAWTLTTVPSGSGAALSDATAAQPSFTVDMAGDYVATLVVNDGTVDSPADTVTVTASAATAWGTASVVQGPSIGTYTYPQVASDTNGNFFALWIENDGLGQYSLWVNRYDASLDAWGTAQQLAAPVTGAVTNGRLAVNGSGEAVAAWSAYGAVPAVKEVYASLYDPGTGTWGVGEIVDSTPTDTHFPEVAIDPSGNAFVVWHQSEVVSGTSTLSIRANRYDAGTGQWGTAVALEQSTAMAAEPRVAVDASGNATVVWFQVDGSVDSVAASRYDAGTGTWGAAQWIDQTAHTAGNPHVAVDGAGNVFAAWWEQDGSSASNANDYLVAARYDAGTGTWGTPTQLDVTSIRNNFWNAPALVADPSGNAVVAWEHRAWDSTYGDYANDIYAARYEAGTGWATAAHVDNDFYPATTASLAVDGAGNALLVWAQLGYVDSLGRDRYSVYAASLPASGGAWSAPEPIETQDGHGITPQVALSPAGAGLAVWNQAQGSTLKYDVYGNFYR